MTNTKTRTAKWYSQQIDSAYRAVASLERMIAALAALPTDDYVTDELARLAVSRDEMSGEVDYLMESAIDAGYGPEDIEAAAAR